MHCVLTAIILALGSTVASSTAWATPPVDHPAQWRTVDSPRVGVADATAIELDDGGLALIGGFTDLLQATAAVQRRDPKAGWEPIGTSLLTPRSAPLVARLPENGLLVVGGWTGTLPHDVVHLSDAELCDPRRPEQRRALPAPFPDRSTPGLEGATMCTLADGRILLIHDRDLAIFDPTSLTWSLRSRGGHVRRFAAAIALPDGSALIIGGGDEDAPAVESIRIDPAGGVERKSWESPIDPRLQHPASLRLNQREVLVAGGEIAGRSVVETWLLDVVDRKVRAVSPLPIVGGLSRGTLVHIDDRVLLVGGETVDRRFPSPASHGAVLRPPWNRPLRLAASPVPAVRTMVVSRSRGALVIGGYRFDTSVAHTSRVQVHRAICELSLPVFAIVD